MKSVVFTVRGVTYEGRQDVLARLQGGEAVKIVPEPSNAFDSNALAVYVSVGGEVLQVGYVPKEHAAEIAPMLDGETTYGEVMRVTGGFLKADGNPASYGLIVIVEFPEKPTDVVK